mmetsp:Transcript_3212/g.7558  ORF Transcript_3212/g.7558 Transcript_3212/m.7558 type:complete len:211 (+) Transcript_3212:77-709(+)
MPLRAAAVGAPAVGPSLRTAAQVGTSAFWRSPLPEGLPCRGAATALLPAAAAAFVFLGRSRRLVHGARSRRATASAVSRKAVGTSDEPEEAAEEKSRGDEPTDSSIDTMRKFSNQYARKTDTFFCSDKSVAAVVVTGLAHHKETLGAPLCPCRHYEDKEKEVKDGYWNCPCVPMRERRECHCMLFLQPNNPFSSDCQNLDLEEVLKLRDT